MRSSDTEQATLGCIGYVLTGIRRSRVVEAKLAEGLEVCGEPITLGELAALLIDDAIDDHAGASRAVAR